MYESDVPLVELEDKGNVQTYLRQNLDRRLLYLFQERKVSELEAPGCRLYMIYDTQSTTNAYHRARPSRAINKESKKPPPLAVRMYMCQYIL